MLVSKLLFVGTHLQLSYIGRGVGASDISTISGMDIFPSIAAFLSETYKGPDWSCIESRGTLAVFPSSYCSGRGGLERNA